MTLPVPVSSPTPAPGEAGGSALPARHLGLEELVAQFIRELDVAPSSRATYGRQLRQFTTWLEETGRMAHLGQLQREDLLAYKEHLRGRLSSYSVTGYFTAVRKLFGWLETRKIYPNIAQGIKGAKKPKGHRKDSLTPAQIRRALQEIDTTSASGLRDFAIVNLMARTGLRAIEVARAEVGDVRQEGGEAVLWIQGKGRDAKDDFVLLTEETLRPVQTWLTARGRELGRVEEGEALFCSLSPRNKGEALTTRSLSRIVKEALRNADLDSPRLTAHSLRHTAVTLAIKGGASLHQAQAMARHADPRTTQVYFHNLDRVKHGAEKCISF